MPEVNLEIIKSEISVFWENDDERIQRYIDEAKAELLNYAGVDDMPFTAGTIEGSLLINLVRYKWNKMSEYFEENYKSKIISLRLKYQGLLADEKS